ncbi:MAG: asparagine synthase (glutamine-hydrolyzing) [Verrucomicrobiota bacterium JB023]|nr:asparagine synthase (glutamine-hydrolyzing) [Verrucomicrobiota bacterium JB023]
MCGILGRLSSHSELPAAALASLRHRGPDHQATFSHPPFQLGYTRLAILDQEDGNQPFASPDGRVHAFCNGEIYNWRELRTQLEQRGHRFQTQCDSEILPAAWLTWGTQLPEKLNGMFALVIHDAATDSLFLARDRCGQKPLYYSTKHPFAFASEIKALAAMGLPLEPDPRYLATWLSLRYLPEPTTMFKDIVTLPAAHWMTVSKDRQIRLERYWAPDNSPQLDDERGRRESDLDYLDRLTRSSVELALQANVPMAAYLSGGVDSALLAYYLKDLGGDFTTISIGFGAASDETAAAEETAKLLGLTHHVSQLQPSSLLELPRVVAQMERPIGDALILAFDQLAAHSASLGCKVVLGGEGPDEHFAGYSFQKAYAIAHRIGPAGRHLAASLIDHMPTGLLDRLAQFPASLGPAGRAKTSNYLRTFGQRSFFERATGLHTLFEPEEIQNILHPDLLAEQQPPPLLDTVSPAGRLNDLLALQYRHWLPDWSLIRQDKNTMAHSVEYRAPFLDHRLIDLAFSLPPSSKINRSQDKAIWRQLAARHLPSSITKRPKQPFYLPLEQAHWQNLIKNFAQGVLESNQAASCLHLQTCHLMLKSDPCDFLPLKKIASLAILGTWLNNN